MEILEFRALLQYLLEVVTYVFTALLLEIATEVVACKFENTCGQIKYLLRVTTNVNENYFKHKHNEFVESKKNKTLTQTNNLNSVKYNLYCYISVRINYIKFIYFYICFYVYVRLT